MNFSGVENVKITYDQREGEQQQAEAVAAVGRVDALRTVACGGEALPEQPERGEDTDLGMVARREGVDLVWVGGAHAYHQHHPVSSPPVEHLDDILRNGALFAERWGEWPMSGWIDGFVDAGAVEPHGDGFRRVPAS